jgi:hypothetical protein
MRTALEDLRARLTELKADLAFVTAATQLRPRLAEILQWSGSRGTIQLAQRFMDAKESRPEGIYGPLLVRLMAVLERYVRLLVVEGVEHHTSAVKTFDELPQKLANRNLILTGRILASLDSPRDYLSFNVEELIVNLASCKAGSDSFRLNPHAFSASLIGISPAAIDKALESIEVGECWDAIGGDAKLEAMLGTKGARATGSQSANRLKELSRWRNHLAHGGDEIAITEAQLRDAIDFVWAFTTSLDTVVKKHLKAGTKSH